MEILPLEIGIFLELVSNLIDGHWDDGLVVDRLLLLSLRHHDSKFDDYECPRLNWLIIIK